MCLTAGAIALSATQMTAAMAAPRPGPSANARSAGPVFHVDGWWAWFQCVSQVHEFYAAYGVDIFDPDFQDANMAIINSWCGHHLL
ncbi:hypothetical protein D1871_06165 [Nakamurella silvestris]|nr:hypothetical protein D1871_06165 [Nakamurella silvestris]